MRRPMRLMEVLDKHGALSASDAAEMLGMSRSYVSRQAHNLVARGWARELADPDDKRLVIYDLTRIGKTVLDGGDEKRRYSPIARATG